MLKCDLHLHSNRSPDCNMRPDSIIRTCVRRGITCIALTDHNTFAGARELKEKAPFLVIPGEEIKTTRGEIIGLFISEEIPRGKSPGDTAQEIHAQGGVVYIPHPFDRVRKSALQHEALLEIVDLVDVVEVRNSRTTFPADQVAADQFAAAHGKLRGAGSDAHVWWELGHSYVEMPEFEGATGFLRALALGTVHGKLTSPVAHVASTITKWRKKYLVRKAL